MTFYIEIEAIWIFIETCKKGAESKGKSKPLDKKSIKKFLQKKAKIIRRIVEKLK